MALTHRRSSSEDAPEVYCPPPPPPPSTLPDQLHSHAVAGLTLSQLPTPPAENAYSYVKLNATAEISQPIHDMLQQQYSSPNYSALWSNSQTGQPLVHFPPTPISPPSSRVTSPSSPGYFQTGPYQTQYLPPPPPRLAPPPGPAEPPQQHQPISNASYPATSPSPAATPAVGVQYAPGYGLLQTSSPQQYFPPWPSISGPAAFDVPSSSNSIPNSVYFPPPPSSYTPAPTSPPTLLSSPYLPPYTPVQSLPSPMLNVPQSYGVAQQDWANGASQPLPNASFSPSPVSSNVPSQSEITSSFSNLSLVSQPNTNGNAAASVDDQAEHWSKRFVGNTLAGRVVRASVKSVAATVQLPMYLSPWGDNNPVTLPNVRRRDAALAVVGHFGAEALAPSALELTGEVLKFGVTQAAEQTADAGIHHLAPHKAAAVKHRNGVRSTQVKIKHKLMGSDANLRYVGGRPAARQTDYSKGWFCPLLFASGRTPSIPRANDFAMAEFHGPGLIGRLFPPFPPRKASQC
jgi:hypothetical protein